MSERLDAKSLDKHFAAVPADHLACFERFDTLGSTNDYLLEQAAPAPGCIRVVTANEQTAGRGRMGKTWHSSSASSLCLSVSYSFTRVPRNISAVTLAIGTGLARALEQLGVHAAALKWPNDLIVNDGKLGGILTEILPGQKNPQTIVVGVGINLDLGSDKELVAAIPQSGSIADIASCIAVVPSKDTLLKTFVAALFDVLTEFDASGFESFVQVWQRYDWLEGKLLRVDTGRETLVGQCQGIDADGALKLKTSHGIRRVISGTVTFFDPSNSVAT